MSAVKRSIVWNFFSLSDDKKKAKCDLCKHVFAYHSSTTFMKNHLSAKHKQQWSDATKKDELPVATATATKLITPSIREAMTARTKYATDSPRQKLITDKLVSLITKDMQPLRIVQDEGFIDFVSTLDPRYQLPSRNSLSQVLLPHKYEQMKLVVTKELEAADSVAITTDLRTSRQTKSYIGITAHFLTPDWTLETRVLTSSCLADDHTGENIGEVVWSVCTDWNIFHKLSAIVTDCASNMRAAVDHIGMREKHIFCVGHMLNLIVRKAIEAYDDDIGRVRAITAHFHHSVKSNERLIKLQEQAGQTPLKLIIDVSTRWNSCYDMLNRYIQLHQIVSTALCMINKLNMLSDEELIILKMITAALAPFDKTTREVSSDKYPSLSKVFPITREILTRTHSLQDSPLKERLLTEINKRFGKIEDVHFFTVAVYLDPRFKDFYFRGDLLAQVKQEIDTRSCRPTVQMTAHDPEPDQATTDALSPDNDFGSSLDRRVHESIEQRPAFVDKRLEMDRYGQDLPLIRNSDPLIYWKNKEEYPTLKKMAAKYLTIPATSVPSERLFSKARELISERRNRLKPSKVNMILSLNKNKV